MGSKMASSRLRIGKFRLQLETREMAGGRKAVNLRRLRSGGSRALFCAGVVGGERVRAQDWLRRRREGSVLAGGWRCAEGSGSGGLCCGLTTRGKGQTLVCVSPLDPG